MNTHTIRRSTALVSTAAVAALVLSACGADEAPTAESTEQSAEETAEETTDDAAEETTDASTDAAAATQEADDAEETSSPAEDAAAATERPAGDLEVAAAGTELAFGEPAVLHAQEFEEGEEYYAFGYIESSVTEIVQGDATFFDKFEDTEEYEGLTPYFIMSEHTVLYAEGDEGGTNLEPGFEGILDDGTPAQGLIVISTGIAECPNDYFEDFVAGATATTCNVALAPEGQEVTGAAWTGVREIDGGFDENPYLEAPVTWQ